MTGAWHGAHENLSNCGDTASPPARRYSASWLSDVDNCCQLGQDGDVSRNTMSFALPESMRSYIDERVRDGQYGNTSEYLRDLIRRDQQAEAARRFRLLIADGLESGEGRALTSDVIDDLRARALNDLDHG